jgi:hypothetical protein
LEECQIKTLKPAFIELLGLNGKGHTKRGSTSSVHCFSNIKLYPAVMDYSSTAVCHLENICNVCGGHLIAMNFLWRIWEGYYAYSSRVGRKLCLLMDVKNPPIHTPHELHRFGSL